MLVSIFRKLISGRVFEDTLEQAGWKHASVPKFRMIAHSGPGKERAANVHTQMNTLVLEAIKNKSVGECIHVTGDMRALTDPFHRKVCNELVHDTSRSFEVVYNLSANNADSVFDVIEANARRWAKIGFQNKLSAYKLIANSNVQLFAYDTSNEIQFSVFGNRFVQLQSKHIDDGSLYPKKHVWLFESDDLHGFFLEKAKHTVGKSKSVNNGFFQQFSSLLYGIPAAAIYSKLKSNGGIASFANKDIEYLNAFTDDPEAVFKALEVLGLINRPHEGYDKVILKQNACYFFEGRESIR